jgi:O-antigen/teichoic acid export membrane protein
MAAQPQLAKFFARGDRPSAKAVYQTTTAWLVVLSWPLYLVVIVYGTRVLSLFGHSYRAGATVMTILAISMLLASACGQVDTVLITAGRSWWSLCNGLVAMVVNVVLDVLLIPRYGIAGAAVGWAAAIAAGNLIPLVQVASVVKVHPFGRSSLLAATVAFVCFFGLPTGARLLLGNGLLVTGGVLLVGAGAMGAVLWRFRGVLASEPQAPATRTVTLP